MKVKELIEKLQQENPETKIVLTNNLFGDLALITSREKKILMERKNNE